MDIAVVTGASSGMGREFALQLEKHFKVDEIWVIARREDRLLEIKDACKTSVRVLPLDLLKEKSFDKYKKLLEDLKPNIKVLVNSAGCGRFGDYDKYSLEDDETVINLNITALVRMTRISLDYMEKGAQIVQMGSMSSYQPVPYILTYSASKAFVLSYSRALNKELKPRGIRVMCVTPLWVESEFFNYAFKTNNKKVQNFNKLYTSKEVVEQAYKDLTKTKKDRSVIGLYSKFQILMVKLLPHSLIMKIWMNQQKKVHAVSESTTLK